MADPRHTDLGTPCPQSWSDWWIEEVNRLEAELGRRACGALCPDGTPCPRASAHPSGRCPHHGGHHLSGAPKGNRNALIHGLYSRRLRTCGDRCPLWAHCPFAAGDLLDLPARKRPNCLYEQLEYDAFLQDLDPKTLPSPHLCHTAALLHVMVGRAAAALSVSTLTDTTCATGDRYTMETSKPSAALQAFLSLTREYRRFLRELKLTPAAPRPRAAPAEPLFVNGRPFTGDPKALENCTPAAYARRANEVLENPPWKDEKREWGKPRKGGAIKKMPTTAQPQHTVPENQDEQPPQNESTAKPGRGAAPP